MASGEATPRLFLLTHEEVEVTTDLSVDVLGSEAQLTETLQTSVELPLIIEGDEALVMYEACLSWMMKPDRYTGQRTDEAKLATARRIVMHAYEQPDVMLSRAS